MILLWNDYTVSMTPRYDAQIVLIVKVNSLASVRNNNQGKARGGEGIRCFLPWNKSFVDWTAIFDYRRGVGRYRIAEDLLRSRLFAVAGNWLIPRFAAKLPFRDWQLVIDSTCRTRLLCAIIARVYAYTTVGLWLPSRTTATIPWLTYVFLSSTFMISIWNEVSR